MPTLIATRGLPGSGKSTLALQWVNQAPQRRARVNRDTLRKMLHGSRLGTKEQEELVTAAQSATVTALLRQGLDVVVDDTNLYPEYIDRLRRLAGACGAQVEIWDLRSTPVEVCVARDQLRQESVGEEVIWRLARGHALPSEG